MGTKGLLGLALAAVTALTILGRESPATNRSPRETRATHALKRAPAPETGDRSPEPARRPRIVGTDGPVAGAHLAFLQQPDPVPVASAETDETGSFDMPEQGCDVLLVRADGYPPNLFRPCEEGGGEFRLDPGVVRKLAIVDEDGNPGAYADVDIYYRDPVLWLLLSSTRADERGVATLWLSGHEAILVRLRGFASQMVYDDTVVLRPGFSIAGRVVDTAGVPLPGATIDVDREYG
jgi:hypothetical protein